MTEDTPSGRNPPALGVVHWARDDGGTRAVIGEFPDGRGVFFAQDTYRGRAIFVRFVITRVDGDTCRFEQAFSADGGAHWELNWVATDRRRR